MTTLPKEETYLGVVNHKNIRNTLLLAEMNALKVRAADIWKAYLHGITREKVYIVIGSEFGPELQGRVMIIVKSLYGLTTHSAY